jgi:arylsulfatase A-like enzyme
MPNLGYIANLYDAEIEYLDAEIGRLIAHLEALDVLDETLVVVFADHGENMTEHDAWFDHAGLYDTITHVPLIMRGPGVSGGRRIHPQVALVDVFPTLLELAGLPPVPGRDGRSLLPLVRGEESKGRSHLYLSECTWQAKRGVRTPGWKFIRSYDPGVYPRGGDELYDLSHDPDEQHNVADTYPEVVGALSGALDSWIGTQLQGRPDPFDVVIDAGLPAVTRLDGMIVPPTPPPPLPGEPGGPPPPPVSRNGAQRRRGVEVNGAPVPLAPVAAS